MTEIAQMLETMRRIEQCLIHIANLLDGVIKHGEAASFVEWAEPEIDAQTGMARRDLDKAATTTATGHKVRGVALWSRYGKQHEYDTMAKVIHRLPPALLGRLQALWCDSKATCTYTIEGELSQDDLYTIGIAFVEVDGGHNGINCGDLWVDPDWGVT